MTRRGEFALIAEVFRPLAEGEPLAFDLGDDAALLPVPTGSYLVVTTDAMASGVHFTPDTDAVDVGRKLLRVNLSDLAAMGAEPLAYTLTVALPRDLPDAWVEGFARGLREDQTRYRVHLIGGDTIAAADLVVSMTMLGRVERDCELRRSGARPGDTLYVSGTIGDAGLGLRAQRGELPGLDADARAFFLDRLLHPSPRLRLGRALVAVASAAIDVSDGLLADLGHLCDQSGVAAAVRLGDVPRSAPAADLGGDDLAHLSSGEDYELLFTAPAQHRDAIAALAVRLGIVLTAIGEIAEGAGVRVLDPDGAPIAVERRGFTHF